MMRARPSFGLAAVAFLLGCHDSDTFHDYFHHTTLHEAYHASLEQAGLLQTALGRGWMSAGRYALEAPTPIGLPYQEAGYFPADSAVAVGYLFEARRGEAYVVRLDLYGDTSVEVFLDLFRVSEDSTAEPRHVASADTLSPDLTGEFHRDGLYLLRVQPELLHGAQYVLTIESGPSLAFPVEGRDTDAILSRFGAPRDGGRREHHGVDIFAPRGTPVLAAAPGRITRVREGGLGGKVVWQLDQERGNYLYYAHLDSQAVVRRQTVSPGDTIGFVGNTGNARTTPPHLHFGIYRRGTGAVDPWPFLHDHGRETVLVTADQAPLGQLVRARQAATVRERPSGRAGEVGRVERHTLMRARAATGAWYRVTLPDGAWGYLPATAVELADRPVGVRTVAAGAPVFRGPDVSTPQVATTGRDTVLAVLGSFAAFDYVRVDGEHPGWVTTETEEAAAR